MAKTTKPQRIVEIPVSRPNMRVMDIYNGSNNVKRNKRIDINERTRTSLDSANMNNSTSNTVRTKEIITPLPKGGVLNTVKMTGTNIKPQKTVMATNVPAGKTNTLKTMPNKKFDLKKAYK